MVAPVPAQVAVRAAVSVRGQQQTFDTNVHALDLVHRRIEALERTVRETAEQGPWRELVGKLHCLRGVDTLTALALVAEIGDFARFASAEEFMAFVGLMPCEHSSGEHRRQGSPTKVGYSRVRRLLVERPVMRGGGRR